ncbi:M42 family metallopeptidase [Natranaerobius thermophilus]|uniref:Cellulase n=1 Tax=Natranaerobius thermophilus (strain ATCC BAA-1301 / DSM 18059 / JW/NM-WN-LF) TaxID=457570 RepID=B2A577_NATTJ|nr:M42 family metallopeptidase [Natranaerobius thermophilus]ACB83911.1 Cellulase [Natranaerobius thermophilus JW/NM-WN-LF]
MELLKKLTQTPGIPGREEPIAELIKEEMNQICDEVWVDPLGSVIGLKKGNGNKKVMVAGHMDEIGFIVKHIDKNGFIRLQPVGGFDPRSLMAQRVIVHGKEDLIGNLAPATKPIHVLSPEEKKKQLQVKDYFVDLGLSGEKVKELVEIGDPVTLKQDFEEIGNMYSSKSLDDRVGVYVMLEAAKQLKDHDADIYLVATSQEEVGIRGAMTSSYGIEPDVGIALDVTIAADTPGSEESEQVTKLGEGAAIKIMDSASITNRKVLQTLKDLANEKDINHQMEILPKGGTDAGSIQRSKSGIPVGTISIPCRYVHTVNEMIHKEDLDASVNLLSAFLAEANFNEF